MFLISVCLFYGPTRARYSPDVMNGFVTTVSHSVMARVVRVDACLIVKVVQVNAAT